MMISKAKAEGLVKNEKNVNKYCFKHFDTRVHRILKYQ